MSDYELLSYRGWDIVANGCWEYRGGRNEQGYGLVRKTRAHRIAYEHANGPIADRRHVLHSCDNPPCVNPDHLRAGTATDNMADCLERQRNPRWEATHCANGHPYEGANDMGRGGKARCRTCYNARQARWRANAGERTYQSLLGR